MFFKLCPYSYIWIRKYVSLTGIVLFLMFLSIPIYIHHIMKIIFNLFLPLSKSQETVDKHVVIYSTFCICYAINVITAAEIT